MPKTDWGDVCTRVNSCALSGAAAFMAGVPEADIIANGPLWCYFYALQPLYTIDHTLAKRFTGSQPNSNGVVFGTEECLEEELYRRKKEEKNPSILMVENSCAVSLIGDDIAGIIKGAQLDYPAFFLDSGGLKGGFSEGYSLASLKFIQELNILREKPLPRSVNILGTTPFYHNGGNDFREVTRLLSKIGLSIVSTPGQNSTMEEIKHLTRASLNIVLHEELGLSLAKYLEEKYAMPYISIGAPYGITGTIKWLEEICVKISAVQDLKNADFLKIKEEAESIKRFIFDKNNDLRMSWQELWFDKVLVSAPTTTALSLAKALRLEILDTKELLVMCQNKKPTFTISSEIDKVIYAQEEATIVEKVYEGFFEGLLLGSSSERSILFNKYGKKPIALNIALPSVEENIFTDTPFMGLKGMLNLTEKIWQLKINNIIEGTIK